VLVWDYQPNQLAIQQCFSLTINQPTVLSAMAYQPNESNSKNGSVSILLAWLKSYG